MERSMLAFAVSAAVVLTTETSYAQTSDRPAAIAVSGVTARAVSKGLAPGTTPTPVQQALRQDPLLAAMVIGRLPKGTNLMTVSAGFRDVEEFVGTVNAAKNLGIAFYQLKRRIVNDGMTLGLAIQDMRPGSDYRSAARQAEEEASAIVGRP